VVEAMKKVEAVIKPLVLDEVRGALMKAGVAGMTVSEVRGFGQHGCDESRPSLGTYGGDGVLGLKVEVVVADDGFENVVAVITVTIRTCGGGDGKVFVLSVDDAVHIRTGDHEVHVVSAGGEPL
jgi:nitrogen regulatory protein P-II 1